MGKVFEVLGLGTLGFIGIIIFIALCFAIGTAFTAFFVALIWNWIGLHALFGLGTLTFWQVVGVAAGLNLISGALRPTTISTGS